MRGIAVTAFCLMLSLAVQAQFPIGHATPAGGYTPSLFSEPLWLGNAGYGYRIQGAPPGAPALVAVSAQRHDQMIGGLQVYLSLEVADLIVIHSGLADGTGQALFPVPLAGPANPALAGFTAYAQAAVSDPAAPASVGTSQGLLLEVELPPLYAIATFQTGLQYLDPIAGTATAATGFQPGTTVYRVVFGNGGRDLFVAASNGLFHIDTLAPPSPPVTLATGGSWTSVAWDRVHKRLYAVYPVLGLLTVIDGDRSSPAFGSSITQVASLNGNLSISADGTVLALSTFSGQLERRDADPSSASYLQLLPTAPSPVEFGFPVSVGPVNLSPDGRVASIASTRLIPQLSSLHRFDGVTGQWIDHDPMTPGYQALTYLTHASLSQTFNVLYSRDGSGLVLAGSTSVARVGLDFSSPSNVVVTTTPVTPTTFGKVYDSLSPSGRYLVQREYSPFAPSGPSVFSLVEVSTGAVTPWVSAAAPVFQPPQASAVWR